MRCTCVDLPKYGGKYLGSVYVDYSKWSWYTELPHHGETCLDLGSICREVDEDLCYWTFGAHINGRLRRQQIRSGITPQVVIPPSGIIPLTSEALPPNLQNLWNLLLTSWCQIPQDIFNGLTESLTGRRTKSVSHKELPKIQLGKIPPSFQTHLRWSFQMFLNFLADGDVWNLCLPPWHISRIQPGCFSCIVAMCCASCSL